MKNKLENEEVVDNLINNPYFSHLNEKIKKIEARNKKVELDKKWETCYTRKICIMILTYIIVIIYSYLVRNYDNVLLSSIVPVIGYTLSTLSLKLIRKIWEKKLNRYS